MRKKICGVKSIGIKIWRVEGTCKEKISYNSSIWWRDLGKICESLDEFASMLEWKMGICDKFKFWEDLWEGEQSLANKFLRLFLNLLQRAEFIGNLGEWIGEKWRWKI